MRQPSLMWKGGTEDLTNRECWGAVELASISAKLGDDEQGEQEGADDVDLEIRLGAIEQLEGLRVHASILEHSVQALQTLCLLGEGLHTGVLGEIDCPHLDHASALGGLLDITLRLLALGKAAAAKNDFGGTQADEVAGCLLSKTGVAAGDDDGLARACSGQQ